MMEEIESGDLKEQIDNAYKTARLGYGAPGFETGGLMDAVSGREEFIKNIFKN